MLFLHMGTLFHHRLVSRSQGEIPIIELTQLRHSASQSHLFACGSMVLADRVVCGFSALGAEKPHAIQTECTTLPKADHATCVSPKPTGSENPWLCKSLGSC
jgi:hypothetical protein